MRNSAASIQESSREAHESSAIPRSEAAAGEEESMADVCSVCLAEFRERQQVIWLPVLTDITPAAFCICWHLTPIARIAEQRYSL
ncbi:hypothetical protein AXF42_Ash013014 [Apostasia shenzhenica]|uniref:Uncharacterized protein n=1 Tax=Apostasia shenzhenica TaxID=1088818 RepID=A0A2I0ARX2_9ASPA|nr:hypothetical protein AXF42_Ash013014 [Apostasia shenzhenica]